VSVLAGSASGNDTSTEDTSTDSAWRGFQNGGQCRVAFRLPIEWAPETEAIAWHAALAGYGQSTPVAYGDRVFVTSVSGDNKETYHVAAYDLRQGTELWRRELPNPTPEENNSYVSRAAPTPAVDAAGLYVFGEGGVLAAFDHRGELLWQRDLVAEFGPIKARHGLASSLEQDERRLFVWVERLEQPYLLAVDKRSGEIAWRVPGLGSTSWGSPRLIPVGEEQHLVCSASGKLAGIDPASGTRLWELGGLNNNTSSTPIPAGDGLFFIAASVGRGEETSDRGASSNGLVKIEPRADRSYQVDYLWRANKATSSFGSPVIGEGSVWIVNRAGVLYRLELESGRRLATQRLECGGIWATPLSDGEHLFFFGRKGTTSVVSLEDGAEVSTNTLWDAEAAEGPTAGAGVQYAVAAVDGYLLIRRGDRLFAIR
jgi:outer membrane protein assembly factor BamB